MHTPSVKGGERERERERCEEFTINSPVSAPHLELFWLAYFNSFEAGICRIDISQDETGNDIPNTHKQ